MGTWEREGGSVGNTFLIMLLSKGVLHLFVHLIFRSSFLISSGCCRPEVNQIKMPAPCSSKNHPCWDTCFIILFATLCKDCRDLFCTFQELHDKNGTYKRRLHTCNHHEAVRCIQTTAQQHASLNRSSSGFMTRCLHHSSSCQSHTCENQINTPTFCQHLQRAEPLPCTPGKFQVEPTKTRTY